MMRTTLCAATVLTAALALPSAGDNWAVVAWDGPATNSFLWDYTEGSGTMVNGRQFNYAPSQHVLVHDVEYDSNGNLFAFGVYQDQANNYVSGLFLVHEPTATLTHIWTGGWRTEGDIAYNPATDTLVVIGKSSGVTSAVSFDVGNGFAFSTLWSTPVFDDVSGLAFESTGAGYFFEAKSNTTGIGELYSFTNTGGSLIGSTGISGGITMGMDMNASDQLHFVTSNGSLYHLTGASGILVENVTNPINHLLTGMAYRPVPEPATVAVTIFGAALLARRRKRS